LAVPAIVGRELELGGLKAVTVAVAVELAVPAPSALVAVTAIRRVEPTSLRPSV
jgi:hypothetical protein